MEQKRFSPSAGIAIGPILFVLALLGVVATIMASSGNNFQSVGIIDRINSDIVSQANLIRNTIGTCNLQYQMARSMSGSAAALPDDEYPFGSALGTATAVKDLVCNPTGGASLWGTNSGILFPPPTRNFTEWMYVNGGASGGRCIWAAPSTANPKGDNAVVAGLTRAAAKFNSAATADMTHEVLYDPASNSQKFIVWITPPTGVINSNCEP